MGRKATRKRRSTFSNVAALEPHGTQASGDETQPLNIAQSFRPLNFGGTSMSGPRPSYVQITGDGGYQPIDADVDTDEINNNSRSSIDSTTDLMDHRSNKAGRSKSSAAGLLGSSKLRKRASYMNRWMAPRRDSSYSPGHDAMAIAMEEGEPRGIEGYRDDDERTAVLKRHAFSTGSLPRTGSLSSILSAPNSKPSSRRGSNASSVNDVCYPMDSPREIDSTTGGPKVWPDLEVLNEFAEQELKELAGIPQRVAREDAATGRAASPFTLDGTPTTGPGQVPPGLGGRYSVNEVAITSMGGRLRPHRIVPWDASSGKKQALTGSRSYSIPGVDEKSALDYRFTYFRDDMQATIHSPTISGLLQPDQTFASLFPPRISPRYNNHNEDMRGASPDFQGTDSDNHGNGHPLHPQHSGNPVSSQYSGFQQYSQSPAPPEPSPFWLDVMNPTEEEMKVLSKAFGIHPLTTEDIFLGETREKVELFRNYYLVCFRSIDTNRHHKSEQASCGVGNTGGAMGGGGVGGPPSPHDNLRRASSVGSSQSPKNRYHHSKHRRSNELKPLNMYIVVFHEGVLTFHFAPTFHPINVRRRARLLGEYITVSSDWISYALIDDITDAFAPMIEAIEEEVNSIEDQILRMHSSDDSDSSDSESDDEFNEHDEKSDSSESSIRSSVMTSNQRWKKKGDMLRQIGESRKRVMSLLRLLGSKADVIKGFAKRCNEQWEVAPRNEIGLYLGDIQDHIVTMVQSLNHYEKLLARCHSNYLAQINIDMTKVNNDMNDVLGRITVLGTIVLPMNIVTGLWGMNVLVPGQEREDLWWFWSIVIVLIAFVFGGFYVARRVYKIA